MNKIVTQFNQLHIVIMFPQLDAESNVCVYVFNSVERIPH